MMIHRIINEFTDGTPADYDYPINDDAYSAPTDNGYMEMSDEWLGYLQWLETVEFRAGQ